jgi:hypothetical protein
MLWLDSLSTKVRRQLRIHSEYRHKKKLFDKFFFWTTLWLDPLSTKGKRIMWCSLLKCWRLWFLLENSPSYALRNYCLPALQHPKLTFTVKARKEKGLPSSRWDDVVHKRMIWYIAIGQSPAQVFKRCQDFSCFKTRQKLERCLLTCSFKTTSNMINEMTWRASKYASNGSRSCMVPPNMSKWYNE